MCFFAGDFSDEHGERFHQEISYIEQSYKGKDIALMLGSYINSVIRNKSDIDNARKVYTKRFNI